MVMINRPGLLIRVRVRVGVFLPLQYEYTLTESMKDTEILVILNAFHIPSPSSLQHFAKKISSFAHSNSHNA